MEDIFWEARGGPADVRASPDSAQSISSTLRETWPSAGTAEEATADEAPDRLSAEDVSAAADYSDFDRLWAFGRGCSPAACLSRDDLGCGGT